MSSRDDQQLQESSRTAPVQAGRAASIPWDVHVCAWQVYAALGFGSQSAERIAERGGFGWGELVRLLAERDPFSRSGWEPMSDGQRRRLDALRKAGAEW